MKKYSDLSLAPALQKALADMEYETPTEVQSKTIPLIMEGRDVLVTAQTGTGKTAAFGVPLMQKVLEFAEENPDAPFRRVLVVAPTRELAEQIGQVFRDLTAFSRRMRYCVIIGGSPYPKQLRELKQDPVFVIGTPGRLIDHIESGVLKLDRFDYLVLDEADRMLDMGFAPQMEQIIRAMPKVRQTMMFSATLPSEVKALVSTYLKNPARVEIGEVNRPVERIQQDVIELREGDKQQRLMDEIDGLAGTIIIFVKTKVKADRVAKGLREIGHEADSLHGDLTQGARRRVTNAFRDEKIRILVATDIAARGLDINHIAHVINFDVPMVEEDYIHRIGRTARAGREGHSIIFVTPTERIRWARIQRLMGVKTPYVSKSATRDTGRAAPAPRADRGIAGAPSRAAAEKSARSDRTERGVPAARGAREAVGTTSRAAAAKPARSERGVPALRTDRADRGASRDERPQFEARAKGGTRIDREEGRGAGRGMFDARPARPERADRAERTDRRDRPERGEKFAGAKSAKTPAAKGSRPSGKKDVHADAYHSEEAKAIRAEFEARLAAAEKGLGYDERKAAEVRARGESPMRRIEGGARPGGKKPWKPERKPQQDNWSPRGREDGGTGERGGFSDRRESRGREGFNDRGANGRGATDRHSNERGGFGPRDGSRGAPRDRSESRDYSGPRERSESRERFEPRARFNGGDSSPRRSARDESAPRGPRGNGGTAQRDAYAPDGNRRRSPNRGDARSEESATPRGEFRPRKGGSFGAVGRSGQPIGRKTSRKPTR